MENNKLVKIFLWAALFTGALFVFGIETYNKLSIDDYHFATILKKTSIFEFTKLMYLERGGNHLSWYISGMIIKSYNIFHSILPAGILLYFINISLLYFSIKNFSGKNSLYIFLITAVIFQLMVYSMLSIRSYFWICCKPYLLVTSLTVYALSLLYISNTNFKTYLFLIISLLIVGSGPAIVTPLLILLLFTWAVIVKYKCKANPSKIYVGLLVLAISFIFMMLAPSNWNRLGSEVYTRPDGLVEFVTMTWTSVIAIIKAFIFRFVYLILALPLLYEIFKSFSNTHNFHIKYLFYVSVVFLFFFVSSCILNTYAVGTFLPLRAFNHLSYLLLYLVGLSFFLIVKRSALYQKSETFILLLSLILIVAINLSYSYWNIPSTKTYASKILERNNYLTELNNKGNKKSIYVKPINEIPYKSIETIIGSKLLPTYTKLAIIKPDEISNDSLFLYNLDLKGYLELNYYIYSDNDLEMKSSK